MGTIGGSEGWPGREWTAGLDPGSPPWSCAGGQVGAGAAVRRAVRATAGGLAVGGPAGAAGA